MNVLITSAGRRVSLLQAFREAVVSSKGKVLAADIDSLSAALLMADIAVRPPRVTDPGYARFLLDLAVSHDVGLIVPTIDTELDALAGAADELRRVGCLALVSSPDLIRLAGDKWAMGCELSALGIRTPRSWLPGGLAPSELPATLFVKPRRGSASQDTYRTDLAHLDEILSRVPDPIIQEYLASPEITIDALFDLHSRPIHYVPRLRLRTVGGESVEGVTIDDEEIRSWLMGVLIHIGRLGARGPVTLQAFMASDGPVLSEINPRFGGGVPLCFAAGGAYPRWVMQMAAGEDVESRLGEYKRGLYMSRAYAEYFTETRSWT